MRKSLLLVGAFLTVAAMAQAKEVVPEPVIVEEAPVQIVEKEVIVYRDKEEGFRPNGYVDLQYKYYGDAEETNYKNDGVENNYSRTQLMGQINMTENQSLEYRIRDYNSLNSRSNDEDTVEEGTQTRLRYFYNHGYLGDSKVNLTSRIHYCDNVDESQELEYQARFNFAEYMFNNDFIKTDDFTIAPKYMYSWASNSGDYDNQVGADLYTMHSLPWGFSFEFNIYATQHFYGQDKVTGTNDKTDDNFSVDVEAYIYNTTNLYTSTDGKFGIDFQFEGGFDPYSWNSESILKREYKNNYFEDAVNKTEYEDSKYKLYAWPQIVANYNVTDNFKTYVSLGAEYANRNQYADDVNNWRWQPVAVAGFKTTF